MEEVMRKYVKFLIVLTLVIVLASGLFAFSGCAKEKKAILILPGLMGSIYYTIVDGEKFAIWSGESVEEFGSSLQNMYLLKCDDNGEPLYDNVHVAGWDDKELWRYGANLKVAPGPGQKIGEGDVLKQLTLDLTEEYGDEYEVRVYQYDWRMDLRGLGEELENFIEEQGYTEVVLITHSMGGMVASHYLARSQENIDKVKLFIPIACPFLGSVEIYSYMESGGFPGFDDLQIGGLKLDPSEITGFGNTIVSVYQLFPHPELYESYPEGKSPLTVQNTALSYEEAMNVLKTREWAQKDNSPGIRPQFNLIDESRSALYDDEGVHAALRANTFIIATTGMNTRYIINYTSGDIDGEYDNFNVVESENKTISGDSVVPLYSAALGLVDNDGKPINDNVMIIDTDVYSHMYSPVMPEVKAKIMELVGGLN
jgi:pimeloyl-ACP methyl ester carboxylesterase